MKTLLLGILLIIILGFGGLLYRNTVERPTRIPVPLPEPTTVAEGDTFVAPEGFIEAPIEGSGVVAAYDLPGSTSLPTSSIRIYRYPIAASSTAAATIRATAIGGTSGEPVPERLFSSVEIGMHQYTVVNIERFEAVITTAYYLARGTDVLRFDAIDRDVINWMDSRLDTSVLPAHAAVFAILEAINP